MNRFLAGMMIFGISAMAWADEQPVAEEAPQAVAADVEVVENVAVEGEAEAVVVDEEVEIESVVHQFSPIVLTTHYGTKVTGLVIGNALEGRSILVLHDRWGINEQVKALMTRLADAGYFVLTIDLFDGRVSEREDIAELIMMQVDPVWNSANVKAGVDYLHSRHASVAVLGLGYGGEQAFAASLSQSDKVDVAVVYYAPLKFEPSITNVSVPVLALLPGVDAGINFTQAEEFKKIASLSNPRVEVDVINIEAKHGFADPQYPSYDAKAADEAIAEVERFLAANL